MKKEKGIKCSNCGKIIEKDKDVYLYFDPNNIAITKSMSNKPFCKECAEKYEEGRLKNESKRID